MTLLNNWLWWLISGLLLGAGLLYTKVWILGIVGGILFLTLVKKEENLYKNLLGAWISWSVKASFALSYVYSVYPIDWLSEDLKGIELPLIIVYWVICALFIGLGGSLFVFLYRVIRKFFLKESFLIYFSIAISFVIGEIFGSFIYSLFAIGPGGGLNIYLSLGYSGYLLAEHELLLPLAGVAGVYGLSFLYGLIISFLASWIREKSLRPYVVLIVLVVYLTSFISLPSVKNKNKQEAYTIAVVETNFLSWMEHSEEGKIKASKSLEDAVAEAIRQDFEYIVLPESSEYFNQGNSPEMNIAVFNFLHKKPETVIIDSGKAQDGNKRVVQAFIYDSKNDTFFETQKYYLVPQGEFLSYAFLWIAKALGYGEEIKKLDETIFYEVGSKVSQAEMANNIPGILFCFESMSPLGVHKLMKERENIPFVVHPLSHSWFHSPYTLWHQQEMMLKVQAVWNHTYIVSSANEARSIVISPEGDVYSGDVVAEGDLWKIREVNIPINQQ